MDARLESRYLSSNYTTMHISEDLLKLKTYLKIVICCSYVKSSDPQIRKLSSIVFDQLKMFSIVSPIST